MKYHLIRSVSWLTLGVIAMLMHYGILDTWSVVVGVAMAAIHVICHQVSKDYR